MYEMKMKQEIEAPLREQEFQEDVFLAKIKSAGDWDMKKYLEDRKDERTNLQATQQSKMVSQRAKDTQPIDFSADDNWYLLKNKFYLFFAYNYR
jgi:hypothetical protein